MIIPTGATMRKKIFNLNLDPQMHKAIKVVATVEGKSLHGLILELIEQKIEQSKHLVHIAAPVTIEQAYLKNSFFEKQMNKKHGAMWRHTLEESEILEEIQQADKERNRYKRFFHIDYPHPELS
jgi:hypothetical protein